MKGFALLALALALQSAFFFSVMMTPTASEADAHLAPVDEDPQLVHQLEPILVVARSAAAPSSRQILSLIPPPAGEESLTARRARVDVRAPTF